VLQALKFKVKQFTGQFSQNSCDIYATWWSTKHARYEKTRDAKIIPRSQHYL